MLNLFGCQVEVVTNGQQALNRLQQVSEQESEPYQLVFMDCEMPVKDGFQATREWRLYESDNQLEHKPIIALTAHALENSRQAAFQSGMDDFLRKPFSEQNVADILDKWLAAYEVKTSKPKRKGTEMQVEQEETTKQDSSFQIRLDETALDKLREMEAGGATGLIDRVIGHFLQQGPEQLALIEKGLETSDNELIRTNAHSLKSSSAMLGAMELSALFKDIESHFEQENAVKDYLIKAKVCFEQSCQALNELK